MTQPINSRILDLVIKHSVLIERYKTGVVRQILAMFNQDVAPDIEMLVLKHLGRGTVTETKIKEFAKDLKNITEAYKIMADKTHTELSQLVTSEARWNTALFKNSLPVNIELLMLPASALKEIATGSYVQGKLVKDWYSDLGKTLRDKVVRQINIGMVEGQGIDDIVRRIRGTKATNFKDGILNASRRDIESVVRTSVTTVNDNIRLAIYQENDDVIKGEYWDATLDVDTCKACAALDRQEFKIGEGPRPSSIHWKCRCNRLPILKSWKELGINLKEAPEGTRAAMDGQVPSRLSYGRWLKEQDVDTQDEVLGVGRAQVFRRGEVTIDRFIDARNRPLNLGQLEKLERKLSNN